MQSGAVTLSKSSPNSSQRLILALLKRDPSVLVLTHLDEEFAAAQRMIPTGYLAQRFRAVAYTNCALVNHTVAVGSACHQPRVFQHISQTLR